MIRMVNDDNINSILLLGESGKVEFKANVRKSIRDLPRIVSSFANTEGGIIIFGYDEKCKSVKGTSADEIGLIREAIFSKGLADICEAYTVRYGEDMLIILQVEKSNSIVVSSGGAYVRSDKGISLLSSKGLQNHIAKIVKSSKNETLMEKIEELENIINQIYSELHRSKEEHEKEMKMSKWHNLFFAILGSVIGWMLGKLFP